MAFEVKCSACGKVYTAEQRLLGKRIRCRQCANVFTISASREDASRAQSPPVTEFEQLEASDLTSTTAGVTNPTDGGEDSLPTTPTDWSLRPSVPQNFPMSDVIEAWLPLGLGLIGSVWTIAETFARNSTGSAWIALLRITVVAVLYFAIVVPLMFVSVRWAFAGLRRKLPPSPMLRVAATFAMPVALGYVFWLVSETTGGFVTGILMGVVFMAAVFWLLFRLSAEEAASAFAKVGGAFLVGTALSIALLMAVNYGVNRAMLAQNATGDLNESPLGEGLAWGTPPPPVKPALARHQSEPSSIAPATPPSSPATVVTQPQPPSQPVANNQMPNASPSSPPTVNPTSALRASTITPPLPSRAGTDASPAASANSDPELRSNLFNTSSSVQKPAQDSLVNKIAQAKLPWVLEVARPTDESTYEQTLSPLTSSVYMGFVTASSSGGKQLEACNFTPPNDRGAISLGNAPAASPLPGRCAISPNGRYILRLVRGSDWKVQIDPLLDPDAAKSDPIVLAAPRSGAFGVSASDDRLFAPELLGVLPDDRFLVRWTKPDVQVLLIYVVGARDGLPSLKFNLEASLAPGIYAVSDDGQWFATPVKTTLEPALQLSSLTRAAAQPITLTLKDVHDPPLAQWGWAGLAFSPDGKQLAALLEHDGVGNVHCWTIPDGKRVAWGACRVPTADEMVGLNCGRCLDWLTNNAWLVHGRAVLEATGGKPLCLLTDDLVIGQQVAGRRSFYLNCYGQDGHEHMVVVKFDPDRLNEMASRSTPASHQ